MTTILDVIAWGFVALVAAGAFFAARLEQVPDRVHPIAVFAWCCCALLCWRVALWVL